MPESIICQFQLQTPHQKYTLVQTLAKPSNASSIIVIQQRKYLQIDKYRCECGIQRKEKHKYKEGFEEQLAR
jgi:hypothetical protein